MNKEGKSGLSVLRKIFPFFAFLIFYILLVRLAGTYNNYPHGDWQSEIYADKAGYYIYLPAAFLYGFYEPAYPEGIEEKLGHGFRFEDGKLFDKYPMGTAVLLSPFFLAAHIFALTGQGPADGFSGDYYEMAYHASVFYLLVGAWLLLVFLRRRYSMPVSLLTLLLVMFGTNLFYYAFRDSLMSHVYSFALFALLLLLTDNLWRSPSRVRLFLVALVGGMILLVRPSNIIFLPVILFLGLSSRKEIKRRLGFIFRPVNLLGSVAIVLLLFTPQMIYWEFLSGSLLFNTYQGEGFTFWDHPQVARVLLSPANGLLTYSPAYFLLLPGVVVMFFRKEPDRWLVPLIFLLLLYMTSSWYVYHFGCSFGQRSYVEYLALFSLPVASLLRWGFKRFYPFLPAILVVIMAYLVYMNISLSGVYQKCHQGGAWEWPAYQIYFKKAGIFPFHAKKQTYTWFDDFESAKQYFSTRYHIYPFQDALSGEKVSRILPETRYSDGFEAHLEKVVPGNIWGVDVSLHCYFNKLPGKTMIVCSAQDDDRIHTYKTYRFDDEPGLIENSWNTIQTSFVLGSLPPVGRLKVYVFMKEGKEIFIDDMTVAILHEK